MSLSNLLLAVTLLVISSHSETITIEAGRALANVNNDTITVEGQITAIPGAFQDLGNNDNGAGFTIQDATGGLLVYVKDGETFYADTTLLTDLVLGTTVTVSGTIDTNEGPTVGNDSGGGTVRMKPSNASDIVVGAAGDEVEPLVIKPNEIKDYQGQLVQIQNVNISIAFRVNKFGADYRAEDVDGLFTSIFVYYLWGNKSNEYPILGQQYKYITGFASVFFKTNYTHVLEEEFELWPRDERDLKKLESSEMRVRVVYSQCIMIIMIMYQFI